ncbi:MAG: hypothetical protein JWO19_1513 [Bryobacterales bacterium]|nr:hypothetical protein [Bryobacterales bacterium]
MRIPIAHEKSKTEAIQAVDRAIEEVFRGLPMGPMTIIDQKKTWTGSTITFSLIAKMGFLRNPISGTVEVTDRDVTIDADLGMLNRVFPEEKVHASVESRIRGLLAREFPWPLADTHHPRGAGPSSSFGGCIF